MGKLAKIIRSFFILFVIVLIGLTIYNFRSIEADVLAADQEKAVMDEGKPYMICFYSEQCRLSNLIMPKIREIENDYQKKIKFIYADLGNKDNLSLSEEKEVQVTPTIIIYDGSGALQEIFTGEINIKDIERALKK